MQSGSVSDFTSLIVKQHDACQCALGLTRHGRYDPAHGLPPCPLLVDDLTLSRGGRLFEGVSIRLLGYRRS